MFSGHLKKLLLIVPLLILVSIIVFFTRFVVPQDPVEQSLGIFHLEESDAPPYSKDAYRKEAIKLGLDKATFYFSVIPSYLPNEFHQILLPRDKLITQKLLKNGNSFTDIQEFIQLERNADNIGILSQITAEISKNGFSTICLLYTSPSPRD